MPINFPSSQQEIFNRAVADFQNELPKAGPFLRDNFVFALIVAYSARIFDNYQLLTQLLKQAFPDTATDEYLVRWGALRNITPISATKASGKVTLTGLTTSTIPIGTLLQTSNGIQYETTTPAAIGEQNFAITSLTRSGNVVTAVTAGDHQLATGIIININGADQNAYNGEYTITVTDTNEFIYTLPANTNPATPATGSNIRVTMFGAGVPVISSLTGLSNNLDSGTQVSLVTPLSGVDTDAYVQFGAITGGTDDEEDDRYRKRVLYSYQNPVALFNIAAITEKAMKLAQVDRVFVKPVTPYIGMVTVYFTVNNTASTIPLASDVAQLYSSLLEILPASSDPSDLVVAAPSPKTVNFVIEDLNPNTVTMQNAIVESLNILFEEGVSVGEDLEQAAFQSAVWQTVDLSSGDVVVRANVTTPAATVTVADNELPILGSVSFV